MFPASLNYIVWIRNKKVVAFVHELLNISPRTIESIIWGAKKNCFVVVTFIFAVFTSGAFRHKQIWSNVQTV